MLQEERESEGDNEDEDSEGKDAETGMLVCH